MVIDEGGDRRFELYDDGVKRFGDECDVEVNGFTNQYDIWMKYFGDLCDGRFKELGDESLKLWLLDHAIDQ
jgi:hypothetical protein